MSDAGAGCIDPTLIFNNGKHSGTVISDTSIPEKGIIHKQPDIRTFSVSSGYAGKTANYYFLEAAIHILFTVICIIAYFPWSVFIIYISWHYECKTESAIRGNCFSAEQDIISQFKIHWLSAVICQCIYAGRFIIYDR